MTCGPCWRATTRTRPLPLPCLSTGSVESWGRSPPRSAVWTRWSSPRASVSTLPKLGGSFVDGANRANFLGAKLIVCVNGFTDTSQSAGQMAAFAKANRIPVAVWELSNEPYLYNGFFSSGAEYVRLMKPFRDAIKAADPDAVVAIFFMDAGDTNTNPAWNQSIISYGNPYWDAVTYHHYPPQSTGAFSQWMADENGVLASESSAYVTGYLAPLNPPGTRFLISEFLPSRDGLGTGASVHAWTL